MPTQNPQKFDVDSARKDGYSDDEILQHLTQSRGFDIKSAIADGYSKQDIINHLSANPAIPQRPTEAQQVSSLPPTPEFLKGSVVGNPKAAAATMQPSFLGGAHGTKEQEANINATLPQVPGIVSGIHDAALAGAGAAFPAAELAVQGARALPAIARGTAGAMIGGGAGEYLGSKIGPTTGHVLGTIGGLAGGYAGVKGMKVPSSMGELGEMLSPKEPIAPPPNAFEGATSTAGTPKSMAELPPPSTTSTTSSARVSAKGLTPPPPPQATYVQKFGAPEKGIIVDPNAPNPPAINKTLVSYPADQLLDMAKRGDLDAIHELVRNPRGINLREALPNVKFLMEPGRSTRIYGGPGSTKTLLPAVGIVGAEFNKLGLADPVNPRQQTTLETMMNGPKWKDFDRSEKIEAVRDILGRK